KEKEAETGAARIGVERPGVDLAVARRCFEYRRHLLLLRRQLVEAKLGKALLRLRGTAQKTGYCSTACDAPERMNETHHRYLHRLCCRRADERNSSSPGWRDRRFAVSPSGDQRFRCG